MSPEHCLVAKATILSNINGAEEQNLLSCLQEGLFTSLNSVDFLEYRQML